MTVYAEDRADRASDAQHERTLEQQGSPELRGRVTLDLQRRQTRSPLPDRGAEGRCHGERRCDQQHRRDLTQCLQALARIFLVLVPAFRERLDSETGTVAERMRDRGPAR